MQVRLRRPVKSGNYGGFPGCMSANARQRLFNVHLLCVRRRMLRNPADKGTGKKKRSIMTGYSLDVNDEETEYDCSIS
jgi:hypothetical protein